MWGRREKERVGIGYIELQGRQTASCLALEEMEAKRREGEEGDKGGRFRDKCSRLEEEQKVAGEYRHTTNGSRWLELIALEHRTGGCAGGVRKWFYISQWT